MGNEKSPEELAVWLEQELYTCKRETDKATGKVFLVVGTRNGPFSIVEYIMSGDERKIITAFSINEMFRAMVLYGKKTSVAVKQLMGERNMGGYRNFMKITKVLEHDSSNGILSNYELRRTFEYEGTAPFSFLKNSEPTVYELVKQAAGHIRLQKTRSQNPFWDNGFEAGVESMITFFSHTRTKQEIELERLNDQEEMTS